MGKGKAVGKPAKGKGSASGKGLLANINDGKSTSGKGKGTANKVGK